MKLLKTENLCVLFCAITLVLVVVLLVRKNRCPCSREGFANDNNGLNDEVLTKFLEAERSLNERMDSLESRVATLEAN
jgi:hypothetical protein